MPTFRHADFLPIDKKSPDFVQLHENQGYDPKGNFRLVREALCSAGSAWADINAHGLSVGYLR